MVCRQCKVTSGASEFFGLPDFFQKKAVTLYNNLPPLF